MRVDQLADAARERDGEIADIDGEAEGNLPQKICGRLEGLGAGQAEFGLQQACIVVEQCFELGRTEFLADTAADAELLE